MAQLKAFLETPCKQLSAAVWLVLVLFKQLACLGSDKECYQCTVPTFLCCDTDGAQQLSWPAPTCVQQLMALYKYSTAAG